MAPTILATVTLVYLTTFTQTIGHRFKYDISKLFSIAPLLIGFGLKRVPYSQNPLVPLIGLLVLIKYSWDSKNLVVLNQADHYVRQPRPILTNPQTGSEFSDGLLSTTPPFDVSLGMSPEAIRQAQISQLELRGLEASREQAYFIRAIEDNLMRYQNMSQISEESAEAVQSRPSLPRRQLNRN